MILQVIFFNFPFSPVYVNLHQFNCVSKNSVPTLCATAILKNEMLREQIASMKEEISVLEKEKAISLVERKNIESEVKIIAKLGKLDLRV